MVRNIQEIINNFKSFGVFAMNDFFTISGWLFGLISTLIAVLQYKKKEKYYKQLKRFEQKNDRGSTGYQAETITVNNKK